MELNDNVKIRGRGLEFHFYLYEEIKGPKDYIEMITFMDEASPEDVVYLHINTPGGDLEGCIALLNAIGSCEAQVIGCADGEASSGGSILFFACDNFVVSPFATFLLHDGSSMAMGKMNENAKSVKADSKLLKKVYHTAYGRFFSKKEIKNILKGQDLYLDADGAIERIEKFYEEEEQMEDE